MSNVNLTIGGRRYTVASAAGEEAHVEQLGRTIDARVQALGGAAGQSETRMLLFAALMLADELHERDKVTAARATRDENEAQVQARLDAVAAALENLAERLETDVATD